MFIHLGDNAVIPKKDIIGIFDIDNTSVSAATRNFLNKAAKEDRVIYINNELPKSFIVTEYEVYISSLASATLTRRYNDDIHEFIGKDIRDERNDAKHGK